MLEIYNILIGIGVLIVGFFIGDVLARFTREELKQGEKWFRLIILLSMIGGIVGLILRDDVLMFSLFFIAIVTSRSLKRKS